MYWFLGNTGAAISASTAPSHPMHSSIVHYAVHYSSDAATQAAPASYGNDGRLDIEQPTGDGLALPSCSTFSGNIFAVDPNISGAGTTLVNERLDIQQPTGDGQMLPSCSMFSGNIFAADPSNSGAGTTLVNQRTPGVSTDAPWNMTPSPTFGAYTTTDRISNSRQKMDKCHHHVQRFQETFTQQTQVPARQGSRSCVREWIFNSPQAMEYRYHHIQRCRETFSQQTPVTAGLGPHWGIRDSISKSRQKMGKCYHHAQRFQETFSQQTPDTAGQGPRWCVRADPNNSGAGTTLVNQSVSGASGESSKLQGTMDSSAALVCDICDFAFERADDLQQHMSDHAARKRHLCNFCGRLWVFLVPAGKHHENWEDPWTLVQLSCATFASSPSKGLINLKNIRATTWPENATNAAVVVRCGVRRFS
ncbi:hypothetical protein HPB50_017308 [Hyalomma asiaticum]|uniref:Uncharacterized protein n=1 Tax=Hyalomma asiaticum TaxID=266040 RepID=A0ACB7T2D3_HYAAI|nr:hypothetical protein HPB50_017308 [Hyalomma asiaticum]